MKFSETLISIGHPVAFYAKLTSITGSTLATLFLCQFYYWMGKQRDVDGWIYKTQAEIEEETGLKRKEQEQARNQLKKLGFMEERYKGIPRKLEFRICADTIDDHWSRFIHTGMSQAIKDNTEKAQKKASNLPKINTARNGHYRVSDSDNIECPIRTGYLYTEITYRDYLSKTTNPDKAHANAMSLRVGSQNFNQFNPTNPVHGDTGLNQSSVNQTGGVSKKREERKCSANLPKKKKDDFEYDDYGYVRLPCRGKNGRAGTLALKTMQLLIASRSERLRACWDERNGCVLLEDPYWDSLRREDEWFRKVPFRLMRNDADSFDRGSMYEVDLYWFNDLAIQWFEFWKGVDQRKTYLVFNVLLNEGVLDTDEYPVEWLQFDEEDVA